MSIRLLGILILFLWKISTYAQSRLEDNPNFEAIIEELIASQDGDQPFEDLYESLLQYYRQPLNLNTATGHELTSLGVLSPLQVQALVDHREKHGRLLSIYELQAIPHFSLSSIYRLLPFVKVQNRGLHADNRTLWERISQEKNNFLLIRHSRTLQAKRGFGSEASESQRYLGSPGQWYARYRISHSKDFSLGFTIEKDDGEAFFAQNTPLPDFFSAHLLANPNGVVKTWAVGDYQLQFGQGLVLGAGFQIGKGGETTAAIRRGSRGLMPYTSSMESRFFRGVGTTFSINKNLELTTFSSLQKLDANIVEEDSLGNSSFAQSIQYSGYHRSQTEIDRRRQLEEQVLGSHLMYRNRGLELGVLAVHTVFEKPFYRLERDYNQFEFRGKENQIIGSHYSFSKWNTAFFGEMAMSASGGVGMVHGMLTSLGSQVELAILYRDYDRGFHSFYGNSFGESSRNSNEKGLYWGIKVRPVRKWILSAYYDWFKFPWLRFQVDSPGEGNELLVRAEYRPSRQLSMFIQYRQENRDRNLRDNVGTTDIVVPTRRENVRWNIDYKASEKVSLRSRVQWGSFTQEEVRTEGFMALQDITLDFKKVRVSTRAAVFDTDFETRQFTYEKDVLYAFAIPAYQGQGYRHYWLVNWKPSKKIQFWAKYAITRYNDRQTISSGGEQIEGNVRSDLRMQVRYRF